MFTTICKNTAEVTKQSRFLNRILLSRSFQKASDDANSVNMTIKSTRNASSASNRLCFY